MHRLLGVLLVLLVLAAPAAGSITALSGATLDRAGHSSRLVAQTKIVGALPVERRVLRAILDDLGPSEIRRIGIKPIAPRRLHGLPRNAVIVTVSAGTSLRGRWESLLVVGRYTAEAWRLHLRRPVRLSARGESGRPHPVRVSSVQVNIAAARRVLRAAGSRLVEYRRPFGALILTVRTADAASFLKYHAKQFLKALGSRPSTYWAVEDAGGAVVYANGTVPDVGMTMTSPDLAACGPNGVLGATEAPCPA